MPSWSRPNLPAGPLRDLNAALHDVHGRLGAPSSRAVATWLTNRAKNDPTEWQKVSHTTVRAQLSGDGLPDLRVLIDVVTAFLAMVGESDDQDTIDRIKQLWTVAYEQRANGDSAARTIIENDDEVVGGMRGIDAEHVAEQREGEEDEWDAEVSAELQAEVRLLRGKEAAKRRGELPPNELDLLVRRNAEVKYLLSARPTALSWEERRDELLNLAMRADQLWVVWRDEPIALRQGWFPGYRAELLLHWKSVFVALREQETASQRGELTREAQTAHIEQRAEIELIWDTHRKALDEAAHDRLRRRSDWLRLAQLAKHRLDLTVLWRARLTTMDSGPLDPAWEDRLSEADGYRVRQLTEAFRAVGTAYGL